MKKVLLTGGSGFIGAPTARQLAMRGYDVVAQCRRMDFKLGGIRVRRVELLDRAAVDALIDEEKPDMLVHLAWIATPGVYQQSLENLAWARESLYLLERFAQSGGKRAVMVGTCFEYDLSFGFLREDATLEKPDTLYGAAKLSFSILARAYAERFGLSLACARLFYLFGEREHPARAVPYAILSGLRGEPMICRSHGAIRDYMSENMAAAALCDVLESDVRGVINISSGEGLSIRDIFTHVAEKLGRTDLLVFGNEPAIPAAVIGDAHKLHSEVGFVPDENWRTGIDRCIDWWKTAEG